MIEPERWSPCEEEPSERGGWTMPSNGERGRALICANRNAEACALRLRPSALRVPLGAF